MLANCILMPLLLQTYSVNSLQLLLVTSLPNIKTHLKILPEVRV